MSTPRCKQKARAPSKTWTEQNGLVEIAFLFAYARAPRFVFASRSPQGLATVYLVFLLTSIRNAI